ncbi:MAG: hypothetical protein BWY11_00884 [Firmicutes bacterium ADurb.Bin182]|nr:MAG: hypothetical protein BWY11_00884 [Firmicutes bacterium ADurb.Bin182]
MIYMEIVNGLNDVSYVVPHSIRWNIFKRRVRYFLEVKKEFKTIFKKLLRVVPGERESIAISSDLIKKVIGRGHKT